ncbi:hypothetical protein DB29_00316 [Shouchella clausii]|nr:hypothetical protein DB29_00316 [Shouchella clausii]
MCRKKRYSYPSFSSIIAKKIRISLDFLNLFVLLGFYT